MGARSFCASVINRTGMSSAYGRCRRLVTHSQVAIVFYHRVGSVTDTWSERSISVEVFRTQLELLCRDFEVISLDSLVRCLQSRGPLPRKAIVLTFDDGYRDNYLHAFPILRQFKVPATVYLATGYLDTGDMYWWDKARYCVRTTRMQNIEIHGLGSYPLGTENERSVAQVDIVRKLKRVPDEVRIAALEALARLPGVEIDPHLGKSMVLSWEDVRDMDNSGIAFGSHSVTHPILTKLSAQQAWEEIRQSKKSVQERLGKEATTFSYPNGDFNGQIEGLVERAGFTSGVGTLARLVDCREDLFAMGRISGSCDSNELSVRCSGLWQDGRSLLVGWGSR